MAELRLLGWNRVQLAERFNISLGQVDYDLRKIVKMWERECIDSTETLRNKARLRHEQLRKLAVEEFMKSKIREVKCRACDEDSRADCANCQGSGRITVEVSGNPLFLRIINDIDRELRQLDGLDAAKKIISAHVRAETTLEELIKDKAAKAKRLGIDFDRPDKIELELKRRLQRIDIKEEQQQRQAQADADAQTMDIIDENCDDLDTINGAPPPISVEAMPTSSPLPDQSNTGLNRASNGLSNGLKELEPPQ